jgi:hypothetical protein
MIAKIIVTSRPWRALFAQPARNAARMGYTGVARAGATAVGAVGANTKKVSLINTKPFTNFARMIVPGGAA